MRPAAPFWILLASGLLVILLPAFGLLDLKLAAAQAGAFAGLGWLGLSALAGRPPRLAARPLRDLLPWAAFAFLLLVSWNLSPYPQAGGRAVLFQASMMLAGLLAWMSPPGPRQRRLLSALWTAALALACLYALSQRLGLDPSAAYRLAGSRARPMSTFGNPDFLAAFLCVAWPLALAAPLSRPKRAAVLFLALAALLLTRSRAGLVALAAQALALGLVWLWRWNSPPRAKARALALGVLAAALLAGLAWLALPRSMLLRPTLRLPLWEGTLGLCLKRPWLGWGPGSFVLGFSQHLPSSLAPALAASNQFAEDPHDFILSLLWQGGLALLAAFCAVLAGAFLAWRRRLSRQPPLARPSEMPEGALWELALALGLAGLLVQNLFDRNLFTAGSAFFLWTFLGWTDAASPSGAGGIASVSDRGRAALPSPSGAGGIAPGSVRGRAGSALARLAGLALLLVSAWGLWQAARPLVASVRLRSQPDFLNQDAARAGQDEAAARGLLASRPDDPAAWSQLGQALARQRRFQEAARAYGQALRLDPGSETAAINQGNCYFETGAFQAAEESYRRALSVNPRSVDAHFDLGYAYFYQRRLKPAVAEFNAVLRLDPGNAKAMKMKEEILQ